MKPGHTLAALLTAPIVAAGIAMSVRTDEERRAGPFDRGSGRPNSSMVLTVDRPSPRDAPASTPHDLSPVPNPNAKAARQPRRLHPARVVSTLDGRKAYVTLQGSESEPGHEIAIVDLENGGLLRRLAVGSRPRGLALHPGGRFLVVLASWSNYATAVDTFTDRVVSRIDVPYYCEQLVFNRGGDRAYVTNSWKGQVLTIAVEAPADRFEARILETGGFNRARFFGYRDSRTTQDAAGFAGESPGRQANGQLERCARCGWRDGYARGAAFHCRFCGTSQSSAFAVSRAWPEPPLSSEKLRAALRRETSGVNHLLRVNCGTAGCHLQPAGGFVSGPDAEENFRSAVANSTAGQGAESALLRICVPVSKGGTADSLGGLHHPRGGAVFPDPERDADYAAIRRWIDDADGGPGIPVGDKPDSLALSEDDRTLYVANPVAQSISVVDLEARREVRRIFTQSVVTDLAVAGPWLLATSLGSGFGAPKRRDPDGRESLDRENPLAEFSLLRDLGTGKFLPHERQRVLGPFAAVDGTAQEKFRDISNDLLVIDLEAEARAAPARGPGWGLDVSRYAATAAYTRYAADSFEGTAGDIQGDVPTKLLRVAGGLPEQMAVSGDRLFVVNAGTFEVAEYRLDMEAREPEDRVTFLKSYETGLNPRGLCLVPASRVLLTADTLGETLSIVDLETGSRKEVPVGETVPRFPATDAERGELFVRTSILSSDGDQSCVHCHFRDGGDGRAWSLSQTMGTNRARTEERMGGSRKVPSLRNLVSQVPLFYEGMLAIDETLTMILEQNPLTDFAASQPRGDLTTLFCPEELVEQYSRTADLIVTAAPAGQARLPPGVRLVDLAYRRDVHFRRITARYWGQAHGVRDMQRFVGEFQASEPRLLPNPNAVEAAGDPVVRRGRELFFNPEVGCAACHPPPHFALRDGVYNQNASMPPLVTPVPRDNTHTLVSSNRLDLKQGFSRYWDSSDTGRIEEREGFFAAPSLRGGWAMPEIYLHHGQARNLREVICPPGHPALLPHAYPPRDVTHSRDRERGHNEVDGLPDTHGQTSHLSVSDIAALEAFVESIE